MKIQRNVSIFAGQETQSQKAADSQKERKNIFSGNLKTNTITTKNMIQQKKEEAQEKAMKVVGDAWNGDKTIEADLQLRRDRVRELNMENKDLREKVKDVGDQQESLKNKYGIVDGSKEQEDLDLLRRVNRGEGTEEEAKRAEELKAEGLTEYQEHQLSLDQVAEEYQRLIDKNECEAFQENATIRSIALERLKYAPMVKAEKQADEIKEAASQEIIGMVMEDAKDHVDEEQEKREEQAEKIKEDEEAKEELLEKRKEEKEEREELIENLPMEEMITLNRDKTDIQKEVQDIVDKMKLVAEDLKGAVVDQEV